MQSKSAEQYEQTTCSVHWYHSSSSNSRQNGKTLIRSQQRTRMLNKASAINKDIDRAAGKTLIVGKTLIGSFIHLFMFCPTDFFSN